MAWHQDYSYWTRTKPIAHLSCWCGLDDATKENGCLQYIPKSHTWGLLPKPDIAGELQGIKDFLNDNQKKQFENPQYAEVKSGEAIFHHSLTLHGSGANTSSKPRRAFVINVIADGVISGSDEPLLDGVPPVAKGIRNLLECQGLVAEGEGNIAFGSDPSGFLYVESGNGSVLSWDHDGGEIEVEASCIDEFIDEIVFGARGDSFMGEEWLNRLRTLGLT